MQSLLSTINVLLPVCYGGVFATYLRHFFDSRSDDGAFWGTHLLYATLGLHALFLLMRGVSTGHFPFATRSEFVSLLALSVGATYALAEVRHDNANTGPFFIGIVLLFQLASSFWAEWHVADVPPRTRDPVYGAHVVFTVFGFAGLTLSSLYALMYILLSRQLKSRELGVIFRKLPPLSLLEKMSKLATTSGVVLLGLGLALGHWVAFQRFQTLDPLQHPLIVVADVAWLAYLIGLIVAKLRGLSGIRMGYLSLAGYLLFMGSMVVVITQLEAFHSFS
jgi:ABC-type uncharacterized transport system permease subunit